MKYWKLMIILIFLLNLLLFTIYDTGLTAQSSTAKINTVSLEVKNSSGNAPFTVNFSANTKLATGINIESIDWDFDGNGKVDLNSGKNPVASYTYLKTGIYNASVTVKLSTGTTINTMVKITVSAASSGVSILSPGANQIISGDTPVVVYVNNETIVLQRIELWCYDEITNQAEMISSQSIIDKSSDGKYSFLWQTNTKAQSDHRYYLFIRAYDANNFYLGSPTVLVTIKNNPAAQLLAPIDKSTVNGVVSVLVEANAANPNYPLTRIELWTTDETSNKTDILKTVEIKTPTSNNKYQIQWDTNQNGKDGHLYYLYVKVYDIAGNSYTSASVYVKVRNKPSAVIESPENYAIISGTVPVILSAAPASPDYPLKKIEFYCGDAKVNLQQLLEIRTLDGSSTEQKFTFKWNTNTQARNGQRYQIFFTVYDSANNAYSTTPIYLVVNNTPGAMVISPVDRFIAAGNVEVTIDAYSASPDVPVKKLDLYGLDEELNSKRLFETREISPNYSGRQHKFIWKTNTDALNNHHYYLFVVVTDAFGNTSTSNSVYVTVKNLPSGAIVFPALNQRVSGIVDVKIEANPASKDFPIQRIELWTFDTVSNIKRMVNQLDVKTPNENGTYILKWDTSLQFQNRYELYTTVYDAASNVYTSTPIAVNVDNSPSALLISPVTGDTLSNQVEVKIEAHSASTQFPLKKIELRAIDQFTNQAIILETMEIKKEQPDSKYTIPWDTGNVQSGRKYSIYCRVYDLKDNFINSNDAIIQVNNIPVVTLINPVDKMFISGMVDIRFNAQAVIKNQSIKRAEVWIQDIDSGEAKKVLDFAFNRVSANSLYYLKWDSSKDVTNDKKYYFYIRVYDSAGNYYATPNITLMVSQKK